MTTVSTSDHWPQCGAYRSAIPAPRPRLRASEKEQSVQPVLIDRGGPDAEYTCHMPRAPLSAAPGPAPAPLRRSMASARVYGNGEGTDAVVC